MRILEADSLPVRALAFRRDGLVLASGGDSAVVQFWQMPTGERVGSPLLSPAPVRALAFHPRDDQLAWGGLNDRIHLDPPGRRTRWPPIAVPGGVWSLAFSPDSYTLAAGSEAGDVFLFRRHPKSDPVVLRGHAWPVEDLAYDRLGRLLITASHDGTVRLWDADWGREVNRIVIGSVWLRTAALTPDGRLLAVGDDQGLIRLHRLPGGEVHGSLEGHTGAVVRVRVTPDGRSLLSAGADGTVRWWDLSTQRMLHTWDWQIGPVQTLALSPDGMLAAVGGKNGSLVVFDLDPND